jgi:hypothetical protein
MRYQLTLHSAYLRADLFHRRSAEETREFLEVVAAQAIKNERWRVLICVHASDPIFTVEKYGLSSFIDIAQRYAEKIALVADTREVRIAHEYATVLVRIAGVDIKTFREEPAAIAWLEDDSKRLGRPAPGIGSGLRQDLT